MRGRRKKPQGPIRWTTLGSAPYPRPDEPCSGYLLQGDGANVLVDIGGGALAAVQNYIHLEDLHAVWISHLHADHFADMPLLYYAWAQGERPMRKIPILGPAGWAKRVEDFVRSASEHHMTSVFQVVELKDRGIAEIGQLKIQARAVEHGVPSFGLTARLGDSCLAYSGDSGPCDNLLALAKGARVLISEAGTDVIEIPSVHCSPEDAGITAQHAGVRRLVLTHLAPNLSEEQAIERAAENFMGPIEVARPGTLIEV
ncbi:MAG TPA: MBL fold metallo-hydrolase [Candidatus Limnocylindrales bacterium]|jgi:ribonuclease BN (tRNA processing enzyme)